MHINGIHCTFMVYTVHLHFACINFLNYNLSVIFSSKQNHPSSLFPFLPFLPHPLIHILIPTINRLILALKPTPIDLPDIRSTFPN